MSEDWTKKDRYSGGVDAVTLRVLVRRAGERRDDAGVVDVTQAFLTAPLLSHGRK